MPRPSPPPVVASSGAPDLLREVGFSDSLERALELGVVERRKVVGRWLYFVPGTDTDAVVEAVFVAAEEQVQAWLLAATRYLRYAVADVLDQRVTPDAVEAILPELIRTKRFGALGLFTATYQPYLAIYSWADEEEILRQICAMRECLERLGHVRQAALPTPDRPREAAGWKSSILKHGEFLGVGRIDDAALIRWDV